MVLLALTTAIAGIFFGAALYVNLVEHPARVSCGTEAAVKEFGPSYRRGAVMQGSLSAIGGLLGLAAAWQLHDGPHPCWHAGIVCTGFGRPWADRRLRCSSFGW